ncbi:MAG: TIGR02922 family protein [Neptunomonas phycophila]|uniref:TIGR02922 family protein n=1 Tax=Neptunomonas phycophila TaxID=1572645 RepID=UPI003B8BDDCA
MVPVTILFYTESSLAIQSEFLELPVTENGRVNIPDENKEGRTIVAVCRGEVEIMNRLGDRLQVNLFSQEL